MAMVGWFERQAGAVDGLIEGFRSRRNVVGIIGLGYVGLPLAATFAEGGFAVIGFDVDGAKIDELRAGGVRFAIDDSESAVANLQLIEMHIGQGGDESPDPGGLQRAFAGAEVLLQGDDGKDLCR